jgi:hypothetical protein
MSNIEDFDTFEEFKKSDLYKDWYNGLLADNPDTFMHILDLSLFRYYNDQKGIVIPEYPKEPVKIEPEIPSTDALTINEWNERYSYLRDMSSGSNIIADTVSNQINIIPNDLPKLE